MAVFHEYDKRLKVSERWVHQHFHHLEFDRDKTTGMEETRWQYCVAIQPNYVQNLLVINLLLVSEYNYLLKTHIHTYILDV